MAVWRLGHGRGEFQLNSIRVFEREHVNAERRQRSDLAVSDLVLIEQLHCLLQVPAPSDAEAEVIKPGPVGVETVRRRSHRAQAHQQVAAGHHNAAEQDLERLRRRRVIWQRRLHNDLEAEQAGVELAATIHVGDCQPQVMDLT